MKSFEMNLLCETNSFKKLDMTPNKSLCYIGVLSEQRKLVSTNYIYLSNPQKLVSANISIPKVYTFASWVPKNKHKKRFQKLDEEILYFQGKGIIILQGDINAHTNNKPDIIEVGKIDQTLDIEHHHILPSRNSEDHSKTDKGDELLELCKCHNLVILWKEYWGRNTGEGILGILSAN